MTEAEKAEYIQSKKQNTWFENMLPKKKADRQEEKYESAIFNLDENYGGKLTCRLVDLAIVVHC